MKNHIILGLLSVLATVSAAHAHPVSFKGSYGIMPMSMHMRRELELNYSLTASHAIGVSSIEIDYRDKELEFYIPQFNYKLYRENSPDSQLNLYVMTGAGGSRRDGESNLAAMGAFQADYETRRFYTLLLGEHLQTEGIGLNRVRYRIGAAPYLADFDGFHTWFIAQTEWTPELDDEWTVTPLVRFFYQNYLVEVGSSTRGELFVAGIFHF